MAQLYDAFRTGQIAQRMRAELGEVRALRESVEHQVAGGAGQDGLPAMGEVAQPRRAVDRGADVVPLVTQLDLAGVKADAQPDRAKGRGLDGERARDGIGCPAEGDDEAVALALFDGAHATVCEDGRGEYLIEFGHGCGHLVRAGLPQPRRPLDVGEQQRDGSGGKKVAHGFAHVWARVDARVWDHVDARVGVDPVGFAHASQRAGIERQEHQRNRLCSRGNARVSSS